MLRALGHYRPYPNEKEVKRKTKTCAPDNLCGWVVVWEAESPSTMDPPPTPPPNPVFVQSKLELHAVCVCVKLLWAPRI